MVRTTTDALTPSQIRLKRLLMHVPTLYSTLDRSSRERYTTYLHILQDIINSLEKEKGNLPIQS